MSKPLSEEDFNSKVIQIGKILNGLTVYESTDLLNITIKRLSSNSVVSFTDSK